MLDLRYDRAKKTLNPQGEITPKGGQLFPFRGEPLKKSLLCHPERSEGA